jgi:hypothetical protein
MTVLLPSLSRLALLVLTSAVIFLDPQAHAQTPQIPVNVLVDGKFEHGTRYWKSGGNVELGNGYTYGGKPALFNREDRTPNGSIVQTFRTIPGEAYVLKFSMGVHGFNENQQKLQITLDGTTSRLNQTVVMSGSSSGNEVWEVHEVTFTADSPKTTLEFRDVSTDTVSIDFMIFNSQVLGPKAPNGPPVAVPDFISSEHESLTFTGHSLTSNDDDELGSAMTAEIVEQPVHGTITVTGPNNFQYQAPPAFIGTDTFKYRAFDGEFFSNVATATIVFIEEGDFVNGSFEHGPPAWGWTATGNFSLESAPPYTSTHGSNLMAFNAVDSLPNGRIEQEFLTQPGQLYRLEFDVGVLGYNTDSQSLKARVVGTFINYKGVPWSRDLLTGIVDLAAPGGGVVRWERRTMMFVADIGRTRIVFEDASRTTHNIDLLLDNVRLSRVEPSGTIPIVTPDVYDTAWDRGLVIPAASGVLANDGNPGDQPLIAVLSSGASNGTVSLGEDGSFTYFPNQSFSGVDTFYYYATEGHLRVVTEVLVRVSGPAVQKLRNGDFSRGGDGWISSAQNEFGSVLDQGSGATTWFAKVAGGFATFPFPTLTQSIPTIAGRKYKLEFDMKGSTDLRVSITGLNPGSQLNAVSGSTGDEWITHSFSFVANHSSTMLTFGPSMHSVMVAHCKVVDLTAVEEMLSSCSISGSPGTAVIGLPAADEGSYVIERSSDLREWKRVGRKMLNGPGPVVFDESEFPRSETGGPYFFRMGIEGVN